MYIFATQLLVTTNLETVIEIFNDNKLHTPQDKQAALAQLLALCKKEGLSNNIRSVLGNLYHETSKTEKKFLYIEFKFAECAEDCLKNPHTIQSMSIISGDAEGQSMAHTIYNSNLSSKEPLLSFEQWLKSNFNAVGKNENTSRFGKLRHKPALNYLFNTEKDGENFAKYFSLTADKSRSKHGFHDGNQCVFKDNSSKKFAVLVMPETLEMLKLDYYAYLSHYYANLEEADQQKDVLELQLKKQLSAIDNLLTKLDSDTTYRDNFNKMKALAANEDEDGWRSKEAIPTYHLSLEAFIVLNQELYSATEIKQLKTTQ